MIGNGKNGSTGAGALLSVVGLRARVGDELADRPVGVLHCALAPRARRDVDAAVGIRVRPVIGGRHDVHERPPPGGVACAQLLDHLEILLDEFGAARADDGEAANANGAFASPHPGGGHFLFADGHVDFITDDIDLDTYQNYSTINGAPVDHDVADDKLCKSFKD